MISLKENMSKDFQSSDINFNSIFFQVNIEFIIELEAKIEHSCRTEITWPCHLEDEIKRIYFLRFLMSKDTVADQCDC